MTKIDTLQEWLDKQYDEYKKYIFNKINNLIEERQFKLDETYDESRETVLNNILKSIENKPSYERIFEDIVDMMNEMTLKRAIRHATGEIKNNAPEQFKQKAEQQINNKLNKYGLLKNKPLISKPIRQLGKTKPYHNQNQYGTNIDKTIGNPVKPLQNKRNFNDEFDDAMKK